MNEVKMDPMDMVQVKMEPERQLEEFEGNANEIPFVCDGVLKIEKMTSKLEIKRLIELVEEREEIWDIYSEGYKDRNLKKEAWIDISQEINPEFNNLNRSEKNKHCKILQVKWKNLREKYMKYIRSEKNISSGSGSKSKRPYLYSQHLSFLNKIGETAETTSTIPPDDEIEEESETDRNSHQKKPFSQRSKRSRNSNCEDELLKKLDVPVDENRHVSFIKGIIPTLNTLNEDEIFEWQHSCVEALYSIKKRKLYQNSDHSSSTQASSSINNQSFNLQPPLQNLNGFMSQSHQSQPINYSNFQNFHQTTPSQAQSPIDSIPSDTLSLPDS